MLQDSYPKFLSKLDSNQSQSMEEFYIFMVKLLETRPPSILRSQPEEQREEFYHEFFVHCCDKNFAKLRKYQDKGKPFSSWLLTAAWHLAIDKYKRKSREISVEDMTPILDKNPGTEESTDVFMNKKVRDCLSRMSDQCQVLLKAWAVDGMSLEDMRMLIGYPPGNKSVKRVWDEIHRKCKIKLLNCLKEKGISEAPA
jgi:RNA polymerase sigma factor (sigma-70 family)